MKRHMTAVFTVAVLMCGAMPSAEDNLAERYVVANIALLERAISRAQEGIETLPGLQDCKEVASYLANQEQRAASGAAEVIENAGFTAKGFRQFRTKHKRELEEHLAVHPDVQAGLNARIQQMSEVGETYDVLVKQKREACGA